MKNFRSQNVCFTINKKEDVEKGIIPNDDWVEKVQYCVWQYEIGKEEKKLHIQGYIEGKKQLTKGGLEKLLKMKNFHIEKRKGNQTQAIEYCMKEETRVKDTNYLEYGVRKRQGKRTDIDKLKEDINNGADLEKIFDNHTMLYLKYSNAISKMIDIKKEKLIPDERDIRVEIHYGQSGVGKSKYNSDKYKGDIYRLDIDNGTLWFDGYKGEKVLLIDEYEGNIQYSKFVKILDRYKLKCQIKGGSVWAEWEKVIIISNSKPNMWYKNMKRSKVALIRRINAIYRYEHIKQDGGPWKYNTIAETWETMSKNNFELKKCKEVIQCVDKNPKVCAANNSKKQRYIKNKTEIQMPLEKCKEVEG